VLGDPVLPLAVVGALDVTRISIGLAALGRVPDEPCKARFVACHCSRRDCSGVRRMTVVRV
jgi:hypothetical protein